MALRFTPNSSLSGNRLLSVVIGPTGATGATGATGSTGATGATSGIKQAYSSTTTDGDPGAGTFRLNNATPASATEAYLDNIDSGGSTVSTVFDLYDDSTSTVKGYIRFEKSADATVWAQFQVTGSVVDGTGYRKLTLANGAGSGSFTNTDTFAITFTRTGDKGDTGATGATGPAGSMGGPVSSTDNAIVRFDGTGGTTVQDSAVLIDDTTGTTYPAVSDSGALGSATKMWGDLFLASGGVINWNAGDVTVTHSANTLAFAGASSGYSFDAVVLPASSDGAALGSGTVMWSDLFLASGGVLNWNNGDVTVTHSANALAFAGASSGYTFDAVVAPASSDGAALGSASVMWSDLFLASGAVINFNAGDVTITHSANALAIAGGVTALDASSTVGGSLIKTVGKETIWIPASAMLSATTSGPASAQYESATNDVNFKVLDFDASADEHANFNIQFPKSWNAGTVTFRVWWTSTFAGTTGVAWGLQAWASSDAEGADGAWGTAVVVTDDAQGTADEPYITSESSAVTIASTPNDDSITFFRIFRDVSDANDDMTQDARLIGIQLFYTTDAATDA